MGNPILDSIALYVFSFYSILFRVLDNRTEVIVNSGLFQVADRLLSSCLLQAVESHKFDLEGDGLFGVMSRFD